MAVISPLPTHAVAALLAEYGLTLAGCEPAPLGIENTNYFVDADDAGGHRHALVLTVLSPLASDAQASFVAALLDVLHRAGLPVPRLLRAGGRVQASIAGCRALLCQRLAGGHLLPHGEVALPGDAAAAAAIGRFLARMHRAAAPLQHAAPAHPRDPAWLHATLAQVEARLPWSMRSRLATACGFARALLARADVQALPGAIVHGDLFPDNALFRDGHLTGVIDFHHAARAARIFDIAVAANAWAGRADGSLDADRADAITAGYASVSRLSGRELALLPSFRAYTAVAFCLSRLRVRLLEPGLPGHDPEPLQRRLDDELSGIVAPALAH
jgi:homoserine kinase type II